MAEEMDPCECLWNHELAMRRLISLLRHGQSYCTDSECLEGLPDMPASPTSSGGTFLMLFLTLAFAVAMYVMRPRSRALNHDAVMKPMPNPRDQDDGAPPTPPRT